jgi:hypothetical protein
MTSGKVSTDHMAKKRRTSAADPSQTATPPESIVAAVESKIEGFAEDLGHLLGTAQAKAEGWLAQRRLIADNLTQIRDTAQRLLVELTGGSSAARAGRPARRSAGTGDSTVAKKGRKGKKRTMSAEARERIAAAQRARWARQKAGK